MSNATAASPVEEGLPPPPPSSSNQPTTAETTGLLGSGGGADDGDPTAAAATEPRLPTRLLVRQITGEQTALHLSLDDTIGALKGALHAEWGIEADAQRLLLSQTAVAAGGEAEAGGGLPLEEDEVATLRECKVIDGAELLLTLQDAAQGAARRELRETARREAAERAELSALEYRRRALQKRPVAEPSDWRTKLRKGSAVKHEGRVGVVALVVSTHEDGDHRFAVDHIDDDGFDWVLKPGTENTVRLYWEDSRQMSGYVDKDKLYPPSSEEASLPWVVARQKRLRIIEGCNRVFECFCGFCLIPLMLGFFIVMMVVAAVNGPELGSDSGDDGLGIVGMTD
jgi:hypothetical protein